MSRSYRHTPIIGNACASSDKPGKRKANRMLRASFRQELANCRDFDELMMPNLREVSNVSSFPKDGKHYLKNHRAFPGKFRKYMRK